MITGTLKSKINAIWQDFYNENIPDIVERFHNLDKEIDRKRTDKSFMVPVDEIRSKDYDLSFNKYKRIEKQEVVYRPTSEIFEDLKNTYEEAKELMESLEELLGKEE